jgi:hypothetical protein
MRVLDDSIAQYSPSIFIRCMVRVKWTVKFNYCTVMSDLRWWLYYIDHWVLFTTIILHCYEHYLFVNYAAVLQLILGTTFWSTAYIILGTTFWSTSYNTGYYIFRDYCIIIIVTHTTTTVSAFSITPSESNLISLADFLQIFFFFMLRRDLYFVLVMHTNYCIPINVLLKIIFQ